MSEEKNNATFEKVAGSVKETLGKVTNNEKLQAEGTAEKTKGSIKETIEDAKGAVEGFIDGLKDKKEEFDATQDKKEK